MYLNIYFPFGKSHTGPETFFMSCDCLSVSLPLSLILSLSHSLTHTYSQLLFVMVDKDSNHNFPAFSSGCSTNSFLFKVCAMKGVTICVSYANMFLESVSLNLLSLSVEATVENISSDKKNTKKTLNVY